MISLLLLLACSGADDPMDTAAGETGAAPVPVNGTFYLLDPMNGGGVDGAALTGEGVTKNTGMDGAAALSLSAGQPFQIDVASDELLPHALVGTAGEEDFTFVTFVADAATTDQVLDYLGLEWDAGTGIVVVGLDRPDLSPAVGASAALDVSHGGAFVFAGALPELGDAVPQGGMGAVSFVSVPPGDVAVTVTPPEGLACAPWPSGEALSAPAIADTVTVVLYQCD